MSFNKRLTYLWARNVLVVFGAIAALFACGFALLALNSYFGTPLATFIIGSTVTIVYIVWMAYSVAKSQYSVEQLRGEQVMETLKKDPR
jgi:hypothetical protein